ncbi:DUF2795 domain-containing protein [Amycolatopsis nigrescens]|uniref:DUF2795 domain-containing protein n=1 Tax=Amycolatopsis nigrescens TaxID=381445 RepID=UPI00035C98F2|nr:DUF2795 domain-containing protein [Amycolatopsis nigrescens]
MTYADPKALERAIDGLEYPCDRGKLIKHAAARGADDDMLGHLCSLPEQDYADAGSIRTALDQLAQPS